ncbi:MAG: hypothetical protein QOJ98_2076 [Acidobacteriota bacterium]|jgi:hypothetical protein|nr:hypothetical protein [Acidobacteriota bacterium]
MMATQNQHAPAGPERYIPNEAPKAMSEEDPILTPEQLLQAISAMRVKIEQTLAPFHPDAPETDEEQPPIDTDALLQGIGELRMAFERTLPPDVRAALPRPPATDEAAPYMYSAVHKEAAMEDFAFESAVETLELLAEQARFVAEMKREQAYQMALRIYYALEDALATDPDNSEVAAHVENMRRVHQSQYGIPIPEREE